VKRGGKGRGGERDWDPKDLLKWRQ